MSLTKTWKSSYGEEGWIWMTSNVHVYDKLLEQNEGKRIEQFQVIPTLTWELMMHKKHNTASLYLSVALSSPAYCPRGHTVCT